MTIRDSSLEGAGGFWGFWWHIHFPDEVVQRTLQFKTNNDNGMLVSINVLEFVMVIINYCTALHVVWTSPVTDDPHPVILNVTKKFFRFVLDTPHVQAIKNWANAHLFLLFIVD
jgi:hypothetical protein